MVHERIRSASGDGASHAVVGGDQVFLRACTGQTSDGFVGRGDPALQAETAMAEIRSLLEQAGGQMEDICMVTNYTTDHACRAHVYPVIARHVEGVNPVSTGLVVKALEEPHVDFAIDAWAVLPGDRGRGHERFRLGNARGGFLMPKLNYGNARIVRANRHLFLQGQTGMSLDGLDFDGAGDPARQAVVALENVRELLADADATLNDICKVVFYLTDPSYGELVYPALADVLDDVYPVVTGTVVKDLARPELDLEIDVFAMVPGEGGHRRFRVAPSDLLGYRVSQAVRSGDFVYLAGQGGRDLDGRRVGQGEVAAQAQQAMANVAALLDEVGARVEDICKITTYVTEPDHLAAIEPVLETHLAAAAPVSTKVVMEALADPELDVVVDVFAVVSAED